jgi:hypothetical protein
LDEVLEMNSTAEPTLAPPGAGLPAVELFIARLLFRLQHWRGNRNSFNARFTHERETIQQLVKSHDAATNATRVLIKRLPGMEDSSRNWSVWMTLDHLRIVNHGIAKTIASLAKEISPPGQASTAKVKPSPSADSSVVDGYEKSCDAVLASVATAPKLKTNARFTHPWFGALDASGWHAMAGSHMSIHRQQIEQILKGVRN